MINGHVSGIKQQRNIGLDDLKVTALSIVSIQKEPGKYSMSAKHVVAKVTMLYVKVVLKMLISRSFFSKDNNRFDVVFE